MQHNFQHAPEDPNQNQSDQSFPNQNKETADTQQLFQGTPKNPNKNQLALSSPDQSQEVVEGHERHT